MRLLISGMPRCRSGWLVALFNAHGVRAKHDVFALHQGLREDVIIDPAVALLTPVEGLVAFKGSPTICLYAESLDDRLDALGRATDTVITPGMRRIYHANYAIFAENAPVHAPVDRLDDSLFVASLLHECKVPPQISIIRDFQALNIQEHMTKVRQQQPATKTTPEMIRSLERMKEE